MRSNKVGASPLMYAIIGIPLLGLLYLPSRVHAASSSPALGKNSPAVVSDRVIVATSQGIYIQVNERVLQEVLEQIHQMSGVHFSLPHSMRNIPISATIGAPDWPTAIRQLLRSFNTLEVLEKNGKDLLRIFILGHGRAEILPSETMGSLQKDYQKLDQTKTPESPPMIPVPPLPGPPPSLLRCGEGCIQWR